MVGGLGGGGGGREEEGGYLLEIASHPSGETGLSTSLLVSYIDANFC